MSNVLNAFYNSQNQIIDVTKDCEFQWYQEPSSCYAFLEVSEASGDFSDGETVTGGTSNATATVFSSYVDGGRVYVTDVSGTFQAGETITGSSSNQTATVDGFVAERSYTSTPNNIICGTFPDSLISKDVSDCLKIETTLSGSAYAWKLKIQLPDEGIYLLLPMLSIDKKIDSKNTFITCYYAALPYGFNDILGISYSRVTYISSGSALAFDFPYPTGLYPFFSYSGKSIGQFWLRGRTGDKITCRWIFHRITILKLIV